MNQRLVAIHGFAGDPSDWAPFNDAFRGWDLHKINLFKEKPLSYAQWARSSAHALSGYGGRQVLMGYSLGGRLAAHLLMQAPTLFAGAIFVSVHPGLTDASERAARKVSDDIWARKWRSSPWTELQDDWNAQPVFQSRYSQTPRRNEAGINRDFLADGLKLWSLGEQADLRTGLAQISTPQLWLAGGGDQKFVKLGEEMAHASNQVRFEVIPRAGHRVPLDNPAAFTASVASFLESL